MNLVIDILLIGFIIYNFYKAQRNTQDIICKKPNKFVSVIAPPGTGKSCYAAKLVSDALKNKKKFILQHLYVEQLE